MLLTLHVYLLLLLLLSGWLKGCFQKQILLDEAILLINETMPHITLFSSEEYAVGQENPSNVLSSPCGSVALIILWKRAENQG